jgi:hypothetical protein
MQNQEKDFDCKYCDKKFEKGEDYLIHLHRVHPFSDIKCSDCDRIFDCKRNLIDHISRSPGCGYVRNKKVDHACRQCDRVYAHKSSLRYHMQKHANPTHKCSSNPEGIANQVCDYCGLGYVYLFLL